MMLAVLGPYVERAALMLMMVVVLELVWGLCWIVRQLILMMLAVLRLVMERAAADADDARGPEARVVGRAAADADDARCLWLVFGTCGS